MRDVGPINDVKAEASIGRRYIRGRWCSTPVAFWLAYCFAIQPAPADQANGASWYSRELPGLARYYFGWFGGVWASEKGILFAGGDFSLEVSGIHDPRKPKTKFPPHEWFLKAGTEVAVPVGADVSFIHGEEGRLQLTPLPEELAKWGYSAMFRMRVNLDGAPVEDRALILLLREKNSGGNHGRKICLMPVDIEAAKRIIAAGGFLPDPDAREAMGMILVHGTKRIEPVK